MYTYIHICTSIYIYVYTCTHIFISIKVDISISIHVRRYLCTYVFIYIFTCIRKSRHTQSCLSSSHTRPHTFLSASHPSNLFLSLSLSLSLSLYPPHARCRYILQKRRMIESILVTIATPYCRRNDAATAHVGSLKL